MKKIITFLLCLNIVLSAAACAKIDRPDNIDNSSQPEISETEPAESDTEPDIDEPTTVKEYFKIEKLDDSSSKFYIYDKNGNVVLEDGTPISLKISMLGDNIVDIAFGERPFDHHKYYDVENNRFSEDFPYVVASSDSLVAYMDNIESADAPVLIVRDMFDSNVFFKSFSLDWAPGKKDYPIDSASFTENEGELSVIYWSERPAIRLYTVLPIRNESVDYESKAIADYDSILEAYRMMIDSFDTVNTNPHALAYELFGLQNNAEIEWFLDFYQSAYLLFPGRGKDDFASPRYKAQCGYAIKDLNGDGVDELVLLNSNYVIVAIFSTFNGKPVMFGNYNESNYAWIDGDGRIHEIEKGESGTSSHKVYGGIGFELICEFGTSENDEYYQIKNGKKVGITKEEYLSLSDLYGDYSSTATRQVEDFIPFIPLFDKSEIAMEMFRAAIDDEIKVYDTYASAYTYLTSYTPYYSKTPLCESEDLQYAYIDVDGDGVDELIIDRGTILVLRYYAGTVCVYPLKNIEGLSSDGTLDRYYTYSYGYTYEGGLKFYFKGIKICGSELWKVESYDETNTKYYIEGKQTTEEELQKYLADNPRTRVEFFPLELKWQRYIGANEAWEKVNKYWNYADGQGDGAAGTRYTAHVVLKENNSIDPRFFLITLDYDTYNHASDTHGYKENHKQMLVDSKTGELYEFRIDGYDADWVNVETGEVIAPYVKPISVEEAINIAKLHWERYEIEKNQYWVVDSHNDWADDSVHVITIRGLVMDHHYSTFDEIWIDKYTGEAIIPSKG